MAVGDKLVTLDGLKAVYQELNGNTDELKSAVDANNITPISALKLTKGNLSTSTTWNNINDNYLHVVLPVSPGDSVKLKAASDTINIAFVRSYSVPEFDDTVDYSAQDGFTGRLSVGTSGSSYTVPSDVHYLVMMLKVAGYTRTLAECDVNGYNYLRSLSKIITNIISDIDANDDTVSRVPIIVDHTSEYKGGYINCNQAEGTVIDSITSHNNWVNCTFPVSAGDYIQVTGTATARDGRLWAFLDTNKKLLSVSRYAETGNKYLVQANADGYFVTSARNEYAYGVVQIKNGKSIGRVSKENSERDRYYYLRMGNIGLANTPRYIRMCNCYGNPENVHPKVLYIESGFGGHPYWMAYTPYPSGDTQYENPCVAWSDDGFIWKGISANPLATMVDDETTNYNSDTHLVLHGTTLECWYRWVDDTNNTEVIYRRTSTDGVTWTAAEEMLRSTGAKSYLLSPVVVWDSTNSIYRMWVVSSQGGYAIKYYESNSDGTTWTEIRRIDLTYANNGVDYRPWHMDLILDGDNYIALVMCKDNATANTDWLLFITTSADNVTYTTPYAVMLGNEYGWDQMIYRSTIVKIGSKYRIYYSAKSRANRYGMGITEGNDIRSFVGCFDHFDAFA